MALRPSTLAVATTFTLALLSPPASSLQAAESRQEGAIADEIRAIDYVLLATNKTSTLEKEMAEAAEAGYRLTHMMGGETGFGGNEVVAVMARDQGTGSDVLYGYKLLATSKTSTMQKEMREAAEAGYTYRAQSVAETAFGGREVIVIMEVELDAEPLPRADYLLLATKKTSTMEKELREASESGYVIVGMTVAKTTFGGAETVAILERPVR